MQPVTFTKIEIPEYNPEEDCVICQDTLGITGVVAHDCGKSKPKIHPVHEKCQKLWEATHPYDPTCVSCRAKVKLSWKKKFVKEWKDLSFVNLGQTAIGVLFAGYFVGGYAGAFAGEKDELNMSVAIPVAIFVWSALGVLAFRKGWWRHSVPWP
jgi:hypothetical protein